MEWIILIAVVLLPIYLLGVKKLKPKEPPVAIKAEPTKIQPKIEVEKPVEAKVDFVTNKKLMSRAEEKFYKHLAEVTSNRYTISTKVRVADVIRHSCKDRKIWFREFGKMTQKHFDFILLDKETLEIKHAIELDDASHSSKKQMARDKYINELAKSANLNLVRFPTQATYDDTATIRAIEGLEAFQVKAVS